ncbi:MAG: PorP/SprF family type IX secretion system membrane protein [Bacteroidota bacterium]
MKTLLYTKLLAFSLFLAFSLNIQAQDIHHSQFYNTPHSLSPGLTGIFEGDMRFVGNFRSQWYNDGLIPYRTGYGAFDAKLVSKERRRENLFDDKKSSNFFSLGGLLAFDHAGDSQFGTMQLALNGSYTHQIARQQFLSAGVQLAGYQRSFDDADLRFNSQYDSKRFDSGLPTGENFENKNVFYGDFSIGLNWHLNKGRNRTRLDVGAALYHINEPNRNFNDEDDIVHPRKWSIYALGVLPVAEKFDLVANASAMYQGPYTKHVLYGGGRIHLDTRATREKALQLGIGYRFNGDGIGVGDAFYPAAQLHLRNWIFGLSYDINVSDFNVATGNLGGPELSVIYVFKSVPAIDFCPTCPTYL